MERRVISRRWLIDGTLQRVRPQDRGHVDSTCDKCGWDKDWAVMEDGELIAITSNKERADRLARE